MITFHDVLKEVRTLHATVQAIETNIAGLPRDKVIAVLREANQTVRWVRICMQAYQEGYAAGRARR